MFLIAKAQPGAELIELPLRQNNSKKSQAISELAIFGALILVAFAAVLTYIQSMNAQQSLQMKAFRRALAQSRAQDRVVSYTIVKDSPVFDIRDMFGRPDTSRQVASATVCAIVDEPLFPDPDDADDRDSAEIYEVNNQIHTIGPVKISVQYDDGNDYETWISAPIRDVEYRTLKTRTGSLSKSEGLTSISTARSGSVTAQDTTNLILESQGTFRKNYLEDAQDAVEQEPWEKRLKMERLSYDLASFLQYGLAQVLAEIGLIEFPSLCFYGEICFPTCYYNCIGVSLIGGLLKGAAEGLLSSLFQYAITEDVPSGRAVNVGITDGYRASDSLSRTGSFSMPSESFSVSH